MVQFWRVVIVISDVLVLCNDDMNAATSVLIKVPVL
jgi:hypothetical protein